MSPTLKKIISVLMITITSFGILLSLFVLVQAWRFRQPVTVKLQTAFKTTSSLLQTTIVGLDTLDQIVTNVYSSTLYLGDATNALAQTIDNTDQFMDSAGSFIGDSLSNTITNTQTTLESAQSSALVVDNILTALSNIPLLGLKYNPETPLSSALGNVSSSLDPLQESLKGFQDNLSSTQSNLQLFMDQLKLLDQSITEINKNLAASQVVIEKYQAQATSIKAWVDKAVVSLPVWVTALWVMITVFIILLILVQAAILLQGIYMFSGSDSTARSMHEKETSMIESNMEVPHQNEPNIKDSSEKKTNGIDQAEIEPSNNQTSVNESKPKDK